MLCSLRGVFGDPPEGEEDVYPLFHRGDFESFSGDVPPVLQEQGFRVVLPCSFHRLAHEVFDRYYLVMFLQSDSQSFRRFLVE